MLCVMLAFETSQATQSCSCAGNISTEPSFLSHGELNLHGTNKSGFKAKKLLFWHDTRRRM